MIDNDRHIYLSHFGNVILSVMGACTCTHSVTQVVNLVLVLKAKSVILIPYTLTKIQQIAPHGSVAVSISGKKNSVVRTWSWLCKWETNIVAWTKL